MRWLLRLVTGGPLVRGPPTVPEFLKFIFPLFFSLAGTTNNSNIYQHYGNVKSQWFTYVESQNKHRNLTSLPTWIHSVAVHWAGETQLQQSNVSLSMKSPSCKIAVFNNDMAVLSLKLHNINQSLQTIQFQIKCRHVQRETALWLNFLTNK